jgi:ATP-dependent DNA ligase
LFERLRERLLAGMGFVEPCLPSPAKKPPANSNWIHEIKHDGYRLMVRRDPAGVRLFTSPGRSCLIDGEVVACDENGLAIFDRLRHGQDEKATRSWSRSTCSSSMARTTMPWTAAP